MRHLGQKEVRQSGDSRNGTKQTKGTLFSLCFCSKRKKLLQKKVRQNNFEQRNGYRK